MMPRPKRTVQKKRKPDFLVIIVSLLILLGVFYFIFREAEPTNVTYDVVTEAAQANEIAYVEYTYKSQGLDNMVVILGRFNDAGIASHGIETFKVTSVPMTDAQELLRLVETITGDPSSIGYQVKSNISFMSVLITLLPIALGIGFLVILFRNANQGNNKAFDFGKNRAKLSRSKSVTFKDVAGAVEEKEELNEVVDFLKNPKKYQDLGARIPKGILLVGAPGTGKTLLARAVAGEADVPFFTISGSDFVEMFVGVGASRVRDLFKTAKEHSPAIIFIDEIDAVGRQRGAGLGGGHDEREQTLNQLLVEMDGFSANQGIIIIAATNRPDVLDPALLRPGRFDRMITIDLPDLKAREAILRVHARNKKIDPSVNYKNVAQRIPGFSGADIENLLNEAALLSARNNRVVVLEKDLDEAMDRVRMGPAKKSRKYNEREKRVVAYHEAGHAVIGLKLEHANVVQKVTIIPRGRAGGYNLMVPEEETFLQTKDSLLHTITGYLGGRVAEEFKFETVTTGAYNDFQMATKIARAMVTEYGMSALGPIQYETQSGSVFLGRDYLKDKNFSDQVAHEIDQEVRNIINTCLAEARRIIEENEVLLDNIANYLIKVETLTKADIEEIVETGTLSWYKEDEDVVTAEVKETTEEKIDNEN